jgi:hypothetical protein
MIRIASSIVFIVLISSSFLVAAQNNHSSHSNHSSYQQAGTSSSSLAQPIEAGQSVFAAIAEIVAILESDPTTDWSSVNIDALREHLVDMNLLTLNAIVSKELTTEKVVFTITGSKDTQRAIKAMVPAHAKQLALITPWGLSTQVGDNGVTLTLTSKDTKELEKINRLGFFGIMAIGAHHQAHHLAMALEKMH